MQSNIELYREVREAIRLGEYVTYSEMRFCRAMANVYECVPLRTDRDNFNNFLFILYHYGVIQGIRAERARRKGGGVIMCFPLTEDMFNCQECAGSDGYKKVYSRYRLHDK